MKKEGHESRFNVKRIIGFTLKTKVVEYISRDGSPGHFVKTNGQDILSPSSSLGWTDTNISGRFNLPGKAVLTTQPGATIFTAESGASVIRYQDGSMVYAASLNSPVSQHERLRREQRNLEWWDRSPEIMENEYVTETGMVVASLDGGSGKKGTPYRHFKLALPLSETEKKEFDVYAYDQWIGLVDRRKLQANDLVRLRASVQYHEQKKVGGGVVRVPWLRLFDVRKVR